MQLLNPMSGGKSLSLLHPLCKFMHRGLIVITGRTRCCAFLIFIAFPHIHLISIPRKLHLTLFIIYSSIYCDLKLSEHA